VERNGHDRLALFGIGNERSAGFWRGVLRQLVARGALRVKSGEYASLELVAEEARPILRGETAVMLHEEPPAADAPRERPARATSGPPGMPGMVPATLFDALRAWRAETAKTQGVPPYVIFHDTVLRDIAAAQPARLEDLAAIKGVGASKLDRYGTQVLAILAK
jgi:ATP-dependent DNA helicase RecQ